MKGFLKSRLARLGKDESGAGMIEYALLAALIAVTLIAGINLMSDEIDLTFGKVQTELAAVN